jgi:hypothetical protein
MFVDNLYDIPWRIDPLLGKNLKTNNEASDPFLTHGSVNTFPRETRRTQQ